jgi:tRNA modification GTPase
MDPVERIGIDRAKEEAASADLVVIVTDASKPLPEPDYGLPANLARLKVFNKTDLLGQRPTGNDDTIYLSAKTGLGMDLLRDAVYERLECGLAGENDFTARSRHIAALDAAITHMSAACARGLTSELVAEELRLGATSLGKIVGQMTPDEVLGEIFAKFCIGK